MEIDRILNDLADGIPEPSLLRLSEEDVALDMDEVVVDVLIDHEEEESCDEMTTQKRAVCRERMERSRVVVWLYWCEIFTKSRVTKA